MINEFVSQNWYYIMVFAYAVIILGLMYALCTQLDRHEQVLKDISVKKKGDFDQEAEVAVDIYDKLNVLEGRLRSHDESTERLILNIGEFNSQQQARTNDVKNVLADDIQNIRSKLEWYELNNEDVDEDLEALKKNAEIQSIKIRNLVAKISVAKKPAVKKKTKAKKR